MVSTAVFPGPTHNLKYALPGGMDARVLVPVLLIGSVGLLWAPTLAPPPSASLADARDHPGPVRVEGLVATVREAGGRTHVLLRDGAGAAAWVIVEGPVRLSPGDRVRVQGRAEGALLVADPDGVEVLAGAPAVLLRYVARAPWDHEGNLTLHATVAEVYTTVAYLADGGHRLRVIAGRGPWPMEAAPGDRVAAAGRLVYAPDRVGYVFHLDGLGPVPDGGDTAPGDAARGGNAPADGAEGTDGSASGDGGEDAEARDPDAP